MWFTTWKSTGQILKNLTLIGSLLKIREEEILIVSYHLAWDQEHGMVTLVYNCLKASEIILQHWR